MNVVVKKRGPSGASWRCKKSARLQHRDNFFAAPGQPHNTRTTRIASKCQLMW